MLRTTEKVVYGRAKCGTKSLRDKKGAVEAKENSEPECRASSWMVVKRAQEEAKS